MSDPETETADTQLVGEPPIQDVTPSPNVGAGRRFKMVPPQGSVEDSYADGAIGIMVRESVVKLDLYRVAGLEKDTGDEIRALSHRIVMPVTAVIELTNLLKDLLKQMRDRGQITSASAEPGEPSGS